MKRIILIVFFFPFMLYSQSEETKETFCDTIPVKLDSVTVWKIETGHYYYVPDKKSYWHVYFGYEKWIRKRYVTRIRYPLIPIKREEE